MFRAMARQELLQAWTWGSFHGGQHPWHSVGLCLSTACLPACQVPRVLLRFLPSKASLWECRGQPCYLVQCDSKNAE